MESSPGGPFLRPVEAAKIPRVCHKPSRYISYRARLMGLGDRIDVFFHVFSDVHSRLGAVRQRIANLFPTAHRLVFVAPDRQRIAQIGGGGSCRSWRLGA